MQLHDPGFGPALGKRTFHKCAPFGLQDDVWIGANALILAGVLIVRGNCCACCNQKYSFLGSQGRLAGISASNFSLILTVAWENMKNKVHYHFVGNASTGDDLDGIRALDWDEGTIACERHTWVWPLFCQLKMRGWSVSFSYELKKGAVNIVHGEVARWQLKATDFVKYFVVVARADFRPFPYGQFEIVQNKKTCVVGRVYMPHYPQPGLISRDPKRGEDVLNICFAGVIQNSVDTSRLEQDLMKVGCRFVFRGVGQWQYLHDVDILLGVRSLSKKTYDSKPPTKLFNAWHAGIPFIGGYDSAYEQVGIPGENYLRVSSYDELIGAILQLKSNRLLYRQLRENGRVAATSYTPESITDMWTRFLEKEVCPAFMKWSDRRIKPITSRLKGLAFELFEQKIRGYNRYSTWDGLKG